MRLLFDKEDAPSRTRRQKTAVVKEEPSVVFPISALTRRTMGRVDDGVVCLDSSCQGECHDITDEHRGQWLLECCFCGTGQWIPAIDRRLDKPPVSVRSGDFVFPEGQRGAGCTVEEYYRKSPEYIRWAAKSEPNEEIKTACQKYLAGLGEGL